MKKRRFKGMWLLLFVLLACLMMPVGTRAESAADFAGGDGTAENPYLIETENQLYKINQYSASKYYKLTRDLDMSKVSRSYISQYLKGTFDGDGHTIYNVSLSDMSGLFETNEGTILNLYVDGVTVSSGSFGVFCRTNKGVLDNCHNITMDCQSSPSSIGGVCYSNSGKILNCSNSMNVNERATTTVGGICVTNTGTIENCYNTGDFVNEALASSATKSYAGGICVNNNGGKIIKCCNKGNLRRSYSYVPGILGESITKDGTYYCYLGGICANNAGTISQCANEGNLFGNLVTETSYSKSTSYSYVGGICAYITEEGSVDNSYNHGQMVADASEFYVGGIAGYTKGSIKRVYSIGKIKTYTSGNTGNICGYGAGNYIISNTYSPYYYTEEELKDKETYSSFDFKQIWSIDSEKGDGFPTLIGVEGPERRENTTEFAGGNGTKENPYLIETPEHLGNIRYYLDAHLKLIADIGENGKKIPSIADWGYRTEDVFAGVLDGNGHVISGYDGKTGLFSVNCGVIKNLGVINSATYCKSSYILKIGGICGSNYGTIENCYYTGTIGGYSELLQELAGHSIYVGGISGYNKGQIRNCYTVANIYASNEDGVYYEYLYMGGICGYSAANKIENCYSLGNISNFRKDSYDLTYSYMGGISGIASGAVNCYYLEQISRQEFEDAKKCTMMEMKNQDTYVGFDFDSVWTIDENADYPFPQLKSVAHKEAEENTTQFAGGRGVSIDPYLISTKEQLNNVRSYLGASYKLINDIEFSEEDFQSGGAFYNDSYGWSQIGSNTLKPFCGEFNGDGHVISGLYINATSATRGLFGFNAGNIYNLGVCEVELKLESPDNASISVGAIAGFNQGVLFGCYASGNISSSYYGGGITGYNIGTIEKCYNLANVHAISTAATTCTGGICGYNTRGNIFKSYNAGNIITTKYGGGICGYGRYGKYENLYNTGTIGATTKSGSNIGGIVGDLAGTVKNSYNAGLVAGAEKSGAIAGVNSLSSESTNVYYVEGVNIADYCLGSLKYSWEEMTNQNTYVGFDFDNVWEMDESGNYPFPILQTLEHVVRTQEENTTEFAGGTGTITDPYLITNKEELNNVRYYLDACFKLMEDIVFTEEDFQAGGAFYKSGKGWNPIGTNSSATFTGYFDGGEHLISGIYINRETTNVGLFGYNTGIIKNLQISNFTFTQGTYTGGVVGYNDGGVCENCGHVGASNINITGSQGYIGGIVGYNNKGTLEKCYTEGELNVTESNYCYRKYIGGICGADGSGMIDACHNAAMITINQDETSGESSDARRYIGGIVGYKSSSDITNCSNAGMINVDELNDNVTTFIGGIVGYSWLVNILSCNNSGNIRKVGTVHVHVGGIDGYNVGGIIKQCYNTGNIDITASAKNSYVGGISGGISGDQYYVSGSSTVRYAIGEIVNCYNSGNICINNLGAEGTQYAAGIVAISGSNERKIKNSYSVGDISVVSDGTINVGGIIGDDNKNTTVNRCYYLDAFFTNANVHGTKCTEEQMKQQLTYAGFDFDTIWTLDYCGDYPYPQLKSFMDYEVLSIEPENPQTAVVETVELLQPVPEFHVVITYSNGEKTVLAAAQMLGTVDVTNIGERQVYLKYAGVQSTQPVTLKVVEKSLDTIEVTTLPTKATYLLGEDVFDPAGAKVTLHYNNGTSDVIDLTAEMVSEFENAVVGTNALTVTYEDKTTTMDILFIEEASMEVITLPEKTTYVLGQEVSLAGGQFKVTYTDGSEKTFDLTEATISYDKELTGEVEVTATYKGVTTNFNLTFTEKVVSNIRVTAPTELIYIEGENLEVSGGKLYVTYESEDSYGEEIELLEEMLTGYDKSVAGTQTVMVTYGGQTDSFEVEVIGIVLSYETVVYDGSAKEPVVTIQGLTEGTDFGVVYADNINVGTGKVTIIGKEGYKATVEKTFTITEKELEDAILSYESVVYDGNAKEPIVTIEGLAEGVDYEVSYANNVNVGTATVTVTGKGNYTGTVTKTFVIEAKELENATLSYESVVYDGSAKEPTVTIEDLVEGTDYEVAYADNVNAGIATVTVTGKGNYTGTVTKTFVIEAKELENAILSYESVVYDGSAKEPPVIIEGLVEGTDYEVAYADNVNAGIATVTVTGKGNYSGTVIKTFTIEVVALPEEVSVEGTVVYDGSAKEPTVTIEGLVEGIDYEVTYADNVNVGIATVTINGKGNYTGNVTKTFVIEAKELEDATLSYESVVYDGSTKEPIVIIEGLVEGTDYEVTYADNVNAGTATVTIIGKGNYTGTVTKNFVIEGKPFGEVVLSYETVIYDGSAKEPEVTVEGLVEGIDYEVSYTNNINAGTATVQVTGKGNYVGTMVKDFVIEAKELEDAQVSVEDSVVYDPNGNKAKVTIEGLVEGTDYEVTYADNVNIGTATVTITGKGNYTGTVTKTFEITKAPVIKDGLYEILEEAELLNENDYTPESWEIFKEILEEAIEISGSDDATQEDVEQIKERLADAMEQLAPAVTPEPTKSVTEIFTDVYKDWYTGYVQYVYDNGLMTGIKGTTEFQPNANITKAQVAQVLYNMEGQPVPGSFEVFKTLKDVYVGEWYAEAVAWAYNTGVVTGDLNSKKFNPNADVTREQLALMMYRYAQYKKYDTSTTTDFAGLANAENTANWALDGVKWAVGSGLISGIDKNGVKDLAPQGNASRAQVAAILQRFCEKY